MSWNNRPLIDLNSTRDINIDDANLTSCVYRYRTLLHDLDYASDVTNLIIRVVWRNRWIISICSGEIH